MSQSYPGRKRARRAYWAGFLGIVVQPAHTHPALKVLYRRGQEDRRTSSNKRIPADYLRRLLKRRPAARGPRH